MDETRLQDWMNGELPDEALTCAEVEWLQKAVFNAVERKLADFQAPETLQ